jgi:drug/metabolite transporter (DMT)-like permease
MLFPAIAVTMSGIWLIGGAASLTSVAWGDGMCLLAAMFYAIGIPLVGRYVRRHGGPATLTLIQFVFCGVVCSGLGLSFEPVSLSAIIAAWPELALIGIVSKGIAYFLVAAAQQHTRASTTAIILSAEAVFGALAAHIILGETMSGIAMLGAALIMTSIALVQPSRRFEAQT